MAAAEHQSGFEITKHTQYLARKGKLWGVYYGDFAEN